MNSYLDKYDVLKNFKTNDFQKVLIASDKTNPDKVVVINVINKERTMSFISKSQFPNGLNNLVHLEELNGDIIAVTDYLEGTSFSTHINYLETTLKHKTGLAFEYLNKIVCYDAFNNCIKKQFIGEDQITFKNNYIHFNELLLIDETPQNIDHTIVNGEVANVIEKILFGGKITDASAKTDALITRLRDFIVRLKTSDSYKNLHDICEAFRKIYLYDMYIDSEEAHTPGNDQTVINETFGYVDNDTGFASEEGAITAPIIEKVDIDSQTQPELTNEEEISPSSLNDDESSDYDIFDNNQYSDTNAGAREILLEGLSQTQVSRKSSNKNIRKIIALACAFVLLLGIGVAAVKLNPFKGKLKPVDNETKLSAYYTVDKLNDDGLYQMTNESTLAPDTTIKSEEWAVYLGETKLNTVVKHNPKIQFSDVGEYKVVLTIVDSEDNVDSYYRTIPYDEKYNIDALDTIDKPEELNNLNLSTSSAVNKDEQQFRTGTYSLKIGSDDGSTHTESIIVNNISLKDNPIISFWISSSSTDDVNIFIEGLKNDKVLVSKRIIHSPSSASVWDRVKYNCPNSNINRVRLTFKVSNSIWVDDIKIDYYK